MPTVFLSRLRFWFRSKLAHFCRSGRNLRPLILLSILLFGETPTLSAFLFPPFKSRLRGTWRFFTFSKEFLFSLIFRKAWLSCYVFVIILYILKPDELVSCVTNGKNFLRTRECSILFANVYMFCIWVLITYLCLSRVWDSVSLSFVIFILKGNTLDYLADSYEVAIKILCTHLLCHVSPAKNGWKPKLVLVGPCVHLTTHFTSTLRSYHIHSFLDVRSEIKLQPHLLI